MWWWLLVGNDAPLLIHLGSQHGFVSIDREQLIAGNAELTLIVIEAANVVSGHRRVVGRRVLDDPECQALPGDVGLGDDYRCIYRGEGIFEHADEEVCSTLPDAGPI